MRLLGIFFLVLSVGASITLVIDVDPMRETCEGLRDEAVIGLILNILTFTSGACCMYICGSFLTVLLSALTAVSLSRLTLFVYSAREICASHVASAPVNDLLRDVTVYDRAVITSWLALVFFALGVLVVHIKSSFMDMFDLDSNRDGDRERLRTHYKKTRPCDCDEPSTAQRTTWIRIPVAA